MKDCAPSLIRLEVGEDGLLLEVQSTEGLNEVKKVFEEVFQRVGRQIVIIKSRRDDD